MRNKSTRFNSKQAAREYVWSTLTEQKVAAFPFPVEGRIPNFVGARHAAERLLDHPIWASVRPVKCNPDSPQRALRLELLKRGIAYVFPTPRLKGGFYLFDPNKIPNDKYSQAAALSTCMPWGQPLSLRNLPAIDLAVTGSVAVTEQGYRCGKGHGYGDIEYAIYLELGHPPVPVVTTVHDYQRVDYFPPDAHDLSVSIVATPTALVEIDVENASPTGICWDLLSETDFADMPVLTELRNQSQP